MERRGVHLVILHHVCHVGPIERRTGKLGKPIFRRLVLRVDRRWQGDVFRRRQRLQFFAGLAMVGHHALAELLHFRIRRFVGCELTQFDLSHRSFAASITKWLSAFIAVFDSAAVVVFGCVAGGCVFGAGAELGVWAPKPNVDATITAPSASGKRYRIASPLSPKAPFLIGA